MWNIKVRITLLTGLLLALAGMPGRRPNHAGAERPRIDARARAGEAYGKLPLSFEANQGQARAEVKFLSHGGGYALFLTASEAVLAMKKGVLRMRLLGSNSSVQATALEKLPGTVNYFIGNDPKKWRTNVPTYGKVEYRNIYPGVDLVYYGNQQQLEYDLVVGPGVDAGVARLGIGGANRIELDHLGDLELRTSAGTVRLRKPVAYQRTANGNRPVEARYARRGADEIAFEIGAYDHTQPLIIDPVLVYSTYLGGSSDDTGSDGPINGNIALDSAGNAYVSGYTSSTNFPTQDPFQPSNGGMFNAFVTKLNPSGTVLVYSTYLGGRSDDLGGGITVDSMGNAYLTGQATSNNFPTTPGAFQTFKQSAGLDTAAFVTELNSTGSMLLYSTYLSGSSSDFGFGIAVDSAGRASVTGQATSTNFPVTPGAPQATRGAEYNAFVTTLAAGGGSLVFSTYLGGSGSFLDMGVGIALDSSANIYVTGTTGSSNFPLVNPLQPAYGGGFDAFVTKLNPLTSTLVYSTYLGGSKVDSGIGIAVDTTGSAYVTGYTSSTNFPTANPYQSSLLGTAPTNQNAFVAKLNPAGAALVYSTYLGYNISAGQGIAVDSTGAAYVTGNAEANFPLVGSLQSFDGALNPFVTKFNPAGSALIYSTYLGGYGSGTGIAVDTVGDAYVTGYLLAATPAFPTTPGAAQTTYGGGTDAFVAKITTIVASTTAVISTVNPSVFGQQVIFTATVTPTAVNANTPTGTLVFEDAGTPVWVASLSNGTATFTTSGLTVGNHTITASYGGDTNFSASTSAPLTQTVNKAATTTTVTGSPNPANTGQTVTFTATVTIVAPGAGGPTGSVTFFDGTATLGTGVVNSGVATFNISTLGVGSHTITASYPGDGNFTASTSAAFTETVTLAPVSILVTESIKVTDAPVLLLPVSILVTESIKVTDTPVLLLPVSILVTESVTVTDTPNVAPQPLGPVNVSSQVSVTSTGFVRSRVTGTFNGTITVKNTSAQSIAGPIQIVLTNLPTVVSLANAIGTTGGNPYITLPGVASLIPGQSAGVNVQFADPLSVLITFKPITYSGSF
jgi:hypothetical protein